MWRLRPSPDAKDETKGGNPESGFAYRRRIRTRRKSDRVEESLDGVEEPDTPELASEDPSIENQSPQKDEPTLAVELDLSKASLSDPEVEDKENDTPEPEDRNQHRGVLESEEWDSDMPILPDLTPKKIAEDPQDTAQISKDPSSVHGDLARLKNTMGLAKVCIVVVILAAGCLFDASRYASPGTTILPGDGRVVHPTIPSVSIEEEKPHRRQKKQRRQNKHWDEMLSTLW